MKNSRLDTLLIVFLVLFALLALTEVFGDGLLPEYKFIQNSRCFTLFGCNEGFFGYDAFNHVVGGIVWTILVVWLISRYPRVNILHNNFWKSFFVLVSTIALVQVFWELYEYLLDVLDTHLTRRPLHPDELAQPGAADTTGDLVFGFIGSVLGVLFVRVADRSALFFHLSPEPDADKN